MNQQTPIQTTIWLHEHCERTCPRVRVATTAAKCAATTPWLLSPSKKTTLSPKTLSPMLVSCTLYCSLFYTSLSKQKQKNTGTGYFAIDCRHKN